MTRKSAMARLHKEIAYYVYLTSGMYDDHDADFSGPSRKNCPQCKSAMATLNSLLEMHRVALLP